MEEGENLTRTIPIPTRFPTPNLESRPRPRTGGFGCVVCGALESEGQPHVHTDLFRKCYGNCTLFAPGSLPTPGFLRVRQRSRAFRLSREASLFPSLFAHAHRAVSCCQPPAIRPAFRYLILGACTWLATSHAFYTAPRHTGLSLSPRPSRLSASAV